MKYSKKILLIIVFLLAIGMRLAALLSFKNEASLFYVADSYHYVQVAKNLLQHGVYSMEISETPHPDNFRTPLYPLFLLPFVWLKTSFYLPVIIQNILSSAGIVLILLMTTRIFTWRVAATGSLVFALEPFGALISAQLLTEAIFIPLFVLSICFFIRYLQTEGWKPIIAGSALLALSALARPISFYLFIVIPLLVILKNYKSVAWRKMCGALGIFFLISAPWLWFNLFVLHTTSISSIINLQLYEYHGRYFDRWREARGASNADRLPYVSLDPVNKTFNARAIPPIKEVGLSYIKAHKGEYALFYLSRIPRLFTDSGYASILNGISALNFSYDTSNIGGFFDQISIDRLPETATLLRGRPIFVILLLADLSFIIITLLALINPIVHWKVSRHVPKEIIFLLLVLAAYSAIASPIGGARFRIPINIFLFCLATQTIALTYKNFLRNKDSLYARSF